MNDNVKTIDELMEYLNSKGIEAKEDDRQDLINYGYFHGYKGYRFFKDKNHKLPIKKYTDITTTIIFDTNLKSLFYYKIIFIEMALKNITLKVLIENIKSNDINMIFKKGFENYYNSPSFYNEDQKKNAQLNYLKLKEIVTSNIYKNYIDGNPKIVHYYNNNDSYVPIWAIFETFTLGQFGLFYKSLKFEYRKLISDELKINSSADFNKTLLSEYIYLLKHLRNEIAHNGIIYDCRFKNSKEINKSLKKSINMDVNMLFINFDNITDYVALVIYLLNSLHVSKNELKDFVDSYKNIVTEYLQSISEDISSITFPKTWENKVNSLQKYINNLKSD